MMFLTGLFAALLWLDAIDKFDKHPIPGSAYAEAALASILTIFVMVAYLMGKVDDEW